MMYSGLPDSQRRSIKGTLVVAWGLSALGGASAMILSPNTITAELGWVIVLSGAILTVAGVLAAFGVIADRYIFEWVASWVGSAAVAPYLVTVWALTFTDTLTRSMQALLLSSLVAFMANRAVSCAAHAARLRELHAADTAMLRTVEEHQWGPDDGGG